MTTDEAAKFITEQAQQTLAKLKDVPRIDMNKVARDQFAMFCKLHGAVLTSVGTIVDAITEEVLGHYLGTEWSNGYLHCKYKLLKPSNFISIKGEISL